jgi:hypothetical protein
MPHFEPSQGDSKRSRLDGQELADDEVIEVLTAGRWHRAELRYDHFGHRYKLYLPHADKLLRFSTQLFARRVKAITPGQTEKWANQLWPLRGTKL